MRGWRMWWWAGLLLLLAACSGVRPTRQPAAEARHVMVSAVGEAEALHAQARAALETWLDALRQSRCDAVLAGLARSSPIWERRAPLEQACRTDDEALASWRGRQVGEVVWAERNRVTFRLTGGETPTYAVMVREDDQWRYAGDVFTSWTPRPGECASAALLAR